jgi:hydroxymethylglutaryl-CoA reductase
MNGTISRRRGGGTTVHIVTCESYDPLKARRCVQSGVDLGIGVHVPSFNLGKVGGGTVEGNDFSQKQCYEQVLQVDSHHAAAKAAFNISFGEMTRSY